MAEEARRLGRGLAALIGSAQDESEIGSTPRGQQRRAPVEFLRPNPRNPRKEFGEADLEDLSNSIREKGILQPIVVRAIAGGADLFEIIAGERRWRAAQKAGLHEVPIIVVTASDQEALELAIIENVQRTDLNPLEEAIGYERLTSDYGYTHADIAKTIGKSRSHVANMTRLVKLPEKTRQFLSDGKISAGHARALLSVAEPDEVAASIVENGLTVRDVERMAQDQANRTQQSGDRPPAVRKAADADVRALEKRLGDALGLSVSLKPKGEAGELVIRYKSLDQLDSVCAKLEA
jgi:ParB family transcriptional regulator, chromosome partitioning protein